MSFEFYTFEIRRLTRDTTSMSRVCVHGLVRPARRFLWPIRHSAGSDASHNSHESRAVSDLSLFLSGVQQVFSHTPLAARSSCSSEHPNSDQANGTMPLSACATPLSTQLSVLQTFGGLCPFWFFTLYHEPQNLAIYSLMVLSVEPPIPIQSTRDVRRASFFFFGRQAKVSRSARSAGAAGARARC